MLIIKKKTFQTQQWPLRKFFCLANVFFFRRQYYLLVKIITNGRKEPTLVTLKHLHIYIPKLHPTQERLKRINRICNDNVDARETL